MAISPDQQATLQLLLERGQSYADLAELLGDETGAVRARARAALTELGGADPDRNVGLTDYLLGQADPIGRADAVRHLRDDPADHQLATELCETLRAMYPAAELPRLPGEPRTGRRRAPRAAGTVAKPLRAAPVRRAHRVADAVIVIAGVAGVLLLAVVLGISGAFSGGDDETSTASSGTSTTAAAADEQVQRVPLKAVDGGDATGEAVFGLASGDQAFVELSIDGLDPAPADKTYVVWLMLTDDQGYPLSPITVSENGSFQNRFSIPAAVLPVVARVQFVDVSIAPVKTIQKLVRDAIKNTALVIKEPGEVVLRGEIPKAAAQNDSGSGGSGATDPGVSRTQYYCATTLDGYIAEADDSLGWLFAYEGTYDDEAAEPGPMADGGAYERFYAEVGALVSGSTTYEFVLDHLPEGGWPYAGKPYWALSSRDLRIPEGDDVDVRVADAPVGDLHEEMIAAAGERNLWVVGGGNVASQFAAAGLLDELVLTVVPVVLGTGKPLFDERLPGSMRLLGTRAFANGMVELRYAWSRSRLLRLLLLLQLDRLRLRGGGPAGGRESERRVHGHLALLLQRLLRVAPRLDLDGDVAGGHEQPRRALRAGALGDDPAAAEDQLAGPGHGDRLRGRPVGLVAGQGTEREDVRRGLGRRLNGLDAPGRASGGELADLSPRHRTIARHERHPNARKRAFEHDRAAIWRVRRQVVVPGAHPRYRRRRPARQHVEDPCDAPLSA